VSEAHLKEDLRQTFSSFGTDGQEVFQKTSHADFRGSLQQELQYLDMQSKKRRAEAKRRRETERFKADSRRGHEKFMEGQRLGKQRPPWTYTDAPGFLQQPLIEQCEALTCNTNALMCWIYEVQHPDFKPPHHEKDVYGGWTPFMTNIRNEQLYEFKDKEWQGGKMSPAEKMYKERLDRSVELATQLTKQDALERTSGSKKKEILERTVDAFSCLKKTQAAWKTQQVSTHTYFEPPKYATTQEHPGDCYDETIQQYINQPDRATSFKKNMVTASNSKSFWKPPTRGVTGTNRRLTASQELLNRNLRGCTGLKPTPSPTNRTMLLKGTGALSFTHFKDALVEPATKYFSPLDRSGPP
jgi:hypothetical protein